MTCDTLVSLSHYEWDAVYEDRWAEDCIPCETDSLTRKVAIDPALLFALQGISLHDLLDLKAAAQKRCGVQANSHEILQGITQKECKGNSGLPFGSQGLASQHIAP